MDKSQKTRNRNGARELIIARADLGNGFENELAEFYAFLKMELSRGNNTVESYLHDVREFAFYLKTVEGKTSFSQVDADSLPNWLAQESGEIEISTQSRRLSSIKCLAGFLIDEKVWTKNFCDLVSSPKRRRKIPEVLDKDEVEMLLNAPNNSTFEGVRDRAMLELMYGSGLRVSELCSVKFADLDFAEGVIRIRGKGEKTRLVPLGDCASEAIKIYLTERVKIGSVAAELFVTRRKKKMSRKTFWYNIEKYALACGIKKHVKPHMLRHSFATHLLAGGADLMSIREMLGHSDLSTTQIYTSIKDSSLSKEHALRHPRSNMNVREPD